MSDTRTQVRLRPVIRVFVSSTFSDMKHERNALETDAFPKLEQLCQRQGFQFQAIDLRWGVSTEAGLDHRTMRICFDELRRAQEISPRPNFLVLLGNRYGWRPLPEELSVEEFHILEHAAAQIPGSADKPAVAVLREWYRRDDNAVPPAYLLQSRRQDLGDDRDYTRDTVWNQVQAVLWTIINRAMPPELLQRRFDGAAAEGSPPAIVRFQASATEQEIWHGALLARDAREHVLAFFREIENLAAFSDPKPIKDFLDVDPSGSIEVALQAEQDRLKAELRRRLGSANVFHNEAPARLVEVQDNQGGRTTDVTTDHLARLCADVVRRMSDIIQSQIEEYWRKTAQASTDRAARELEIEQREYERFAQERGGEESFVGRQAELQAILDYVGSNSRWPLVIHGASGCGKTALLARASQEVAKTRKRIERFIGVAPRSSDLRSLLSSLCQELRQRNPRPDALPTEIKELRDEFSEHLEAATTEQPLILFLDALDQLADADNGRLLNWLPPGSLPAHVKLVVSCLSDRTTGDPAGQPYAELNRRQIPAENFINLDVLSEAEARLLLLGRWLPKAGRKVSDDQRARIEQRLASPACRQPIYLKLLFEEVQLWHSYDPAPVPDESVPALLKQLFDRLSLETNHGPLLVNRVLVYLSASRHGLAENEILEILFADPEYRAKLNEATEQTRHELPPKAKRIPIALWSRLRFDLAPYLTERAAPGANVLTFYHHQVAEWVWDHFGLPGERPGEAREPTVEPWHPHPRLAKYFTACAEGTDPQKGWETDNVRGFAECVFHLTKAGQHQQAVRLLTNFPFLLHKLRVGLLEGVFEDYHLLRREEPAEVAGRVDIWADFFREHAHILRRGNAEWPTHKILLQLAADHADDSPMTHAAEAWLSLGKCDWTWFRAARRPRRLRKNTCIAVMSKHPNRVTGACELEDKRILSWSYDGSLRLWSKEGYPLAALEGHSGPVWKVIVRRFGGFVSPSDDGTVRLWTDDGQPLTALGGRFTKHRCTKELQDGRLLSWSNEGLLYLWSSDGKLQATLDADRYGIDEPVELGDGRVLFWGTESSLSIWALDHYSRVLLRGHEGRMEGAQVLKDGRILSWSLDGTLRLWTHEGRPIKTLAGHVGVVSGAKILSDGRILSWSADGTLRLWSCLGESLSSLCGHTADVVGARELANGDIMSWSKDGTVRTWKDNGAPGNTSPSGLTPPIHRIYELKGDRVLFVGFDHTIRLVGSDGTNAVCEGFSALPDFLELLNGSIVAWDWGNTVILSRDGAKVGVLDDHFGMARQLGGGDLVTLSRDGTVKVWFTKNKMPELRHLYRIPVCGFLELRSGHLLAWDRRGALWLQTVEGDVVATLDGHTVEVEGASELSDGRILSRSKDGSMRLWSRHGAQLAVLMVPNARIAGVIELSDSRLLSWSANGRLCIWTAQGELLAALEGHTDAILGALELADGRVLSWSKDATLRLWAKNGAALCKLSGHTGEVSEVRELPDGRLLSLSGDGTLRFWTDDGLPIAVLQGVKGEILDDGRVLTWSRGDKLLLWSGEGRLISTLLDQPLEHHSDIQSIQKLSGGRWLSSLRDNYNWHIKNWLWSAEGRLLASMEGKGDSLAIKLSSGRFLTSLDTSLDRCSLRLWSDDGLTIADLEGHAFLVELSDQRLLSWSRYCTLRLWSRDGVPLAIIEGHTGDVRGAFELSDGRVLSWSGDGTLRLWKLPDDFSELADEAKSEIERPPGVKSYDGKTLWDARILTNGRILSWGKKSLYMWSKSGELLAMLSGHTDDIVGAKQLSSGTIVSWSWDNSLRFWSADGKPLAALPNSASYDGGVAELADGRLLSWSPLRISSAQGEPIAHMGDAGLKDTHRHGLGAEGVMVLSDQRILSWGSDTLYIWTSEGRLHRRLEGHERWKGIDIALELSDGRILSSSGRDGTLRLWTPDGQPLKVLEGHAAVRAMICGKLSMAHELPDGRLVSWGFADRSLRLWTAGGDLLEIIYKWGVLGGKVICLSNGNLLFGTEQRTLRLWLADGGRTVSLHGPSGRLSDALELSAGRILTWHEDDDRLWVWSAEGTPLAVFRGHLQRVGGALQLNGGRIVTWGGDGTIRLWTVNGLLGPGKEGLSTIKSDAVAMSVDNYLEPVLLGKDGAVLTFNRRAEPVALRLC